jgi:RNA polymerase sigma-70 factor (ECF subfamily)
LLRERSNKVMEQNEQLLLPMLRNGDAGAIASMMAAHGDRLLRAAYFFCRDRNEAQDLVQETFCRAIPALPGFRGGCLLYTWLYGILRHLYLGHAGRKRRRSIGDGMPEIEAGGPDPERALAREEACGQVVSVLESLPVRYREILVLRFREEMKLGEIAELLGVPVGTVKSRLHGALRLMRRKMPPEPVRRSGREESYEM